ncbi:hypothetical protein [Pseudonocardia acaciae]|uniref:hypothetical protein n=1 Tax=Pseudonocardia acaciae TaxID=551276 RepID=UPI00048D3986|nr:hypothetical protein [Pseudonocardia acaciae]
MTSPTVGTASDPAGLVGSRFEHRALLADGTPVVLRRLGPGDRAEVEALHRELPTDDAYLRFFTLSASSARGWPISWFGPTWSRWARFTVVGCSGSRTIDGSRRAGSRRSR